MHNRFKNLNPDERLAIFAAQDEITLTIESLNIVRADILSVMRSRRELFRAINKIKSLTKKMEEVIYSGKTVAVNEIEDMHLDVCAWLIVLDKEQARGLSAIRAIHGTAKKKATP